MGWECNLRQPDLPAALTRAGGLKSLQVARTLRSSVSVTLLSVLGSAISLFNQLVLAKIFGASSTLDSYLIVVSVPVTLGGLAAGILSYQVVPALRRSEQLAGNADSAVRGLLFSWGSVSVILAIAGGLMAYMLPRNWPMGWGLISQTREIPILAWSWLPLGVLGCILTAYLHVKGRFTLATIMQPLPAVGAIVGCLTAGGYGVRALAWGQSAGYFVLVLALGVASGLKPGKRSWIESQRVFTDVPLSILALLVFVIYPFSDALWGPRAGTSAVAMLGYSQRIVVGFSGLVVVGATTVLFPRMAQYAATGAHAALIDDLARSVRTMLACVAPAAAMLSVVSTALVSCLLQRGAFGPEQTRLLASLLPFMFGGMVAMSAAGLVFKALFAQGHVHTAATLSVIGAATYFCLSGILVGNLGLQGAGLAYVLCWWLLLFSARKILPIAGLGVKYFVRLITISSLSAAVTWYASRFASDRIADPKLAAIMALVTGLGAGAIAFSFLALGWPRLPEVDYLVRRLRSREPS